MSYFGLEHIEGQARGVEPDNTLPAISTGSPILDFGINQGPRVVQNYLQQYKVDSPYSLEFELQDAWQTSLDAYKEKTGQDISLPGGMSTFKRFAELTLGKQVDSADVGNFRQVNDAIKALGDPNVKSFEQVLDEVMQMRKETSGATAQINEGSGIAGTVAEFLGAAAGTLSERDPLTVATLGLGGVGKTIVAKVLADTALGGILSVPGAFESNNIRELLGEPKGNPLLEIAFGAVGAGGLRGAAEGFGKVLEPRELGTLDLNDAQLRSMFERMPDTPTNRAVKDILDADVEMKAANPFGTGEAAVERMVLELDDTFKLVNGEPVAPKEGAQPFEVAMRDEDFAVVKEEAPEVWARLEEADRALEQKILLVHGGSAFDNIDPNRFGSGEPGGIRPLGNGLYGYVARTNDPVELRKAVEYARVYAEKYGKGEKAIQIFEADTNSSQVSFNGPVDENIPRLTRPIDEQAWLDAYEKAGKLPVGLKRTAAFERARLLKEATPEVINQFKVEKLPGGLTEIAALDSNKLTKVISLSTKLSDNEIRVQTLLSLRKKQKRLNSEYEAAYRAVDVERQRLVTARQVIAQAAPDMTNQPLRYDVVEAAAARSAISAEGIDVEASRIVESAKPLELTDIEDDGLIDIGLPERIPADTRITITGDDGNPRSMTVREAMDELDEDVRLEEAMTTCAVGGPNEL